MAKTAYSGDLDALACACGQPDCPEQVYFHSRCHPKAPTWARYDKKTRTITIECSVCKQELIVASVAVSREN